MVQVVVLFCRLPRVGSLVRSEKRWLARRMTGSLEVRGDGEESWSRIECFARTFHGPNIYIVDVSFYFPFHIWRVLPRSQHPFPDDRLQGSCAPFMFEITDTGPSTSTLASTQSLIPPPFLHHPLPINLMTLLHHPPLISTSPPPSPNPPSQEKTHPTPLIIHPNHRPRRLRMLLLRPLIIVPLILLARRRALLFRSVSFPGFRRRRVYVQLVFAVRGVFGRLPPFPGAAEEVGAGRGEEAPVDGEEEGADGRHGLVVVGWAWGWWVGEIYFGWGG